MILAGKMRATAFDERDAWLIYQTRYRPMIRYCLPITMFTDTQYNNTMKNARTVYVGNVPRSKKA